MKINANATAFLEAFQKKEKFIEDSESFYPGLTDQTLKPHLTNLINLAAQDFINTCNKNPSEENFRIDIKKGLKRFDDFYNDLDTEEKERICSYFEELMDCVGLESSGGILNDWLYGFDPDEL